MGTLVSFGAPAEAKNIITKFREAFETYVPGERWTEVLASGDIIQVDGNTIGSSYLVISKDPLSGNGPSSIDTNSTFEMPAEWSVGASLSQRTLGQEFAIEFISDETPLPADPDVAISSISQATTTLSVTTLTPHGLKPGMRFGVRDCNDSRMNYSALVVATAPTPTTLTATAGPGGTIPSVTAGPFATGSIYARPSMSRAPNGSSEIFENATATNASFYVRSASGDVLPSGTAVGNQSVTVGSTASVQPINSPAVYAFQPTTEFRENVFADGVQWTDVPVDSLAVSNNRVKRTQIVPDNTQRYKMKLKATNLPSFTRPVAQIVSVSKTGTTTATVTTDVPHGLTTADFVNTYGVRDTTNFANLTTATAVASIVNATTFTVVWGSAVTATSYGGYVSRVNGGQTQQGASAQVLQSASRTSNIVTIIGSAAWAGFLIGDYINLVGVRDIVSGASLGIDGSYRVRDIATTTAVLEPIGSTPTGTDIVSTNCGGGVIKRTDFRISYVRVFDFERLRVEALPRPTGDESTTFPVRVQNALTVSATNLQTNVAQVGGATLAAEDAAASTTPLINGGVARTAATPTTIVAGDAIRDTHALSGAKVIRPYAVPETTFNASLALTAATAVAIQAAAGTGLKRFLTALQAINTGAAVVDLIILDGVTERWRLPLPINVPVIIEFPVELLVTANTALNANLSAVGTVRANFQGYTAP